MNAVRNFLRLFQNSPTFGRDRANLISALTIGTTALALNGAIMLIMLPVMMNPNDRDFRRLTENIEFGQLLGLILLGGATAFATFLIPMRLLTVFMAPRIGRYFDQIVLSGITPLRFLIGKVTSQNLFLGLILFLLLPWFVLVLALGGLQWPVFLGNLFLVWLYCMMLALVMLWLTLYINEILAMLILIYAAAVLCGLGCAPFPIQVFVVTPFPALMHSIYAAVNMVDMEMTQSYFTTFLHCALGMSFVCGISLAAIYLGPLYGIIRANSTFGEVVRPGDSKRKRRFRFRLHIQRPSEIAFFYENRGDAFRRYEGLFRWGTALCGLLAVATAAWFIPVVTMESVIANAAAMVTSFYWYVSEFHVLCHTIHGIGLAIAIFLFSHSRNTTFQRLPFLFRWKPEVARLDTICFVLFLLLSTTAAIAVPMWIDHAIAIPGGTTMFLEPADASNRMNVDFRRVSIEGTIAITVAGISVYVLQRTLCLSLWMKSASMFSAIVLYGGVFCAVPMMMGAIVDEFPELRGNPFLQENAMKMAMVSPLTVLLYLYRELGPAYRENLSTIQFYAVQILLILTCLFVIRSQGRRLRMEYSTLKAKGNS